MILARRYIVSGRVQGVGYRNFAQKKATTLGVKGYARNLDDGSVEVYAIGAADALTELAGWLRKGPVWGEVRRMEEQEAVVDSNYQTFRIER
jgi:acylphosphatase